MSENKRNGAGRFEWADGTVYTGMFEDDERHGQGVLKMPDGKE